MSEGSHAFGLALLDTLSGYGVSLDALPVLLAVEFGYGLEPDELATYVFGEECPPREFLVALWLSLRLTYPETLVLSEKRSESFENPA